MNDWFPVHLLPVSVFAMLFDYAFAKDLTAKDPNNNAKDRSTQDSVAKFREGYQAIVDHASNIKKIEASTVTSKISPFKVSGKGADLVAQ